MDNLDQQLVKRGFTRNDAIWLWGHIVGVAGIIGMGVIDLNDCCGFGVKTAKAITAGCVLILLIAGRYNQSPLPKDPTKS